MIILGIDPGSRRIGYGLIQKNLNKLKFLSAGILKIKGRNSFEVFGEIKDQMDFLIKKFRPKIMAVEKIYLVRNQKTAIETAEARGIIILSAIEHRVALKEYSPNEIKAGVTGYGLADKKAVAKMVRAILAEPRLNLIDDATDALAIAILASQRGIDRE